MYAFNNSTQKLESIHASDKCALKVRDEDNIKNPYTGQIKLSSSGGMGVIADSNPQPTADGDDRSGWLFTKTSSGLGKFNYYFYSQGSSVKTLGDITSLKAEVSIDNYQSAGGSLPHFAIYTKPTGSGDAGSWYHSRKEYTYSNEEDIFLGECIEIYGEEKPYNLTLKRQVKFNNITNTGECLDNEEILYITLQSNSGAPIDTKILVQSMGVEFGSSVSNFKLIV